MADPYFSNVVLLALNNDGADGSTTFTDQSNDAKALTAVGHYQWDTAQAPTGLTSSGLGDGTGDWLSVAHNANLTPILNEDFTFEWFVFCSALPAGTVSWGWWKRAGAGYSPIACNVTNAGVTQIYMSSAGAAWDVASAVSIGNITTGAWIHYAISRTGSAIRGYKNGVGVDIASYAGALYPNTNAGTIGGANAGAVFPGWHAAMRVTMGVGRYPADFTPPALPFELGVVAPVAAFTGAPLSGDAPLAVTFTDQSTNTPTSWLWDFGDGQTSTSQNPTNVYAAAGEYTVELTATNSAGSDSETKTAYVTVSQAAVGGGTGPRPGGGGKLGFETFERPWTLPTWAEEQRLERERAEAEAAERARQDAISAKTALQPAAKPAQALATVSPLAAEAAATLATAAEISRQIAKIGEQNALLLAAETDDEEAGLVLLLNE